MVRLWSYYEELFAAQKGKMGSGKYSTMRDTRKVRESVSKRLERIEYEKNKDRYRLNSVDCLRRSRKWESAIAPCLTSNKAFRIKKMPKLVVEFFINRYAVIDLQTNNLRDWLYREDFDRPLDLHIEFLKIGKFKWREGKLDLAEMVPPEQWWRYYDRFKKFGPVNWFGPSFEQLCTFGEPEAPKDEVFSDTQLQIPFGTRVIRT